MMVTNQKGFTLIEVLVAMVIFAIGVLAVINMQFVSTHTNLKSRHITEGVVVAQSKIEEMRGWGYNDAKLNDSNGDATLTTAQGSGAAGVDIETELQTTDAWDFDDPFFKVGWNVMNDTPFTNTKTVRVIVKWTEKSIKQSFFMDMVKTNGD